MISELILFLQNEYDLDVFSSASIDAYTSAYKEYYDIDLIENLSFDFISQGDLLSGFVDVEQNNVENNKIIEYITNSENITDEMLYMILPYDTPFCIEYESRPQKQRATAQTFNIEKGVKYALDYATSPNSAYSYFDGGDCTNFASQILHAGDINIHNTNVKGTGWWYKHTMMFGGGIYIPYKEYSLSWTVTPNFIKFMGTSGNVYSDFYTLSSKIKKRDFIAYDETGDGSWDHMAFVRGVGTYQYYKLDNGGTKYYRDFIVAQHTRNYNAWVSNKENGWENLDNGKTKFAIVRRGAKA